MIDHNALGTPYAITADDSTVAVTGGSLELASASTGVIVFPATAGTLVPPSTVQWLLTGVPAGLYNVLGYLTQSGVNNPLPGDLQLQVGSGTVGGIPPGIGNYNLPDYLSGLTLVRAIDMDRIVATFDNNVAGGLQAIGSGTLLGGVGTPTGLSLAVSAWLGVLPGSSARTGFAFGAAPAASFSVPASSTFSVWVVPVAGTYSDTASTPFDTAQTGTAALILVTDGSTPDGGLEMLTGISTGSGMTVTDVRVMIGIAALTAAIAAIEAAIGADYFVPSPPLAIDVRLEALEGAGGAEADYWGAESRSSTDTTTIPAYVASQLPPPEVAPTPPPLVTDIQATNFMKGAFQTLENTYAIAFNAAGGGSGGVTAGQTAGQAFVATLVDCILIRPGITLDSEIDFVHSSAGIVNESTGVIG